MGILKIKHLQIPQAVQMRVLHQGLSAIWRTELRASSGGARTNQPLDGTRAHLGSRECSYVRGKGKQAYLIAMAPADFPCCAKSEKSLPC